MRKAAFFYPFDLVVEKGWLFLPERRGLDAFHQPLPVHRIDVPDVADPAGARLGNLSRIDLNIFRFFFALMGRLLIGAACAAGPGYSHAIDYRIGIE
jgi:hypothetical protein